MRKWQVFKEAMSMAKGIDAPKKVLSIFNAFSDATKNMTEKEKLKYLERRCEEI